MSAESAFAVDRTRETPLSIAAAALKAAARCYTVDEFRELEGGRVDIRAYEEGFVITRMANATMRVGT